MRSSARDSKAGRSRIVGRRRGGAVRQGSPTRDWLPAAPRAGPSRLDVSRGSSRTRRNLHVETSESVRNTSAGPPTKGRPPPTDGPANFRPAEAEARRAASILPRHPTSKTPGRADLLARLERTNSSRAETGTVVDLRTRPVRNAPTMMKRVVLALMLSTAACTSPASKPSRNAALASLRERAKIPIPF